MAASPPTPRQPAYQMRLPSPTGQDKPYQGALAHGGVTLAFALAVFVRFYRLGDIPSMLHPAEDAFRRAANEVMDGRWIGFWSETVEGQSTAHAYLMAGWMYLGGETTTALRIPSATVGLASVGMFYLFCRLLFGDRAAIFGSLLLALSAWHLGYSRLALPVSLFLLVELVTLYIQFLAFGERRDSTRQRRLLVLAGLSFGAGAYWHNAFFIFAVLVALLWVRELLVGKYTVGALVKKSLAFFIPALVVVTPYVGFLLNDAGEVVDRVRDVAVTAEPEYRDLKGVPRQTRYVLANVASVTRDLLWRRGGEEGGRLLDPATALLAGLGLAVALWKWRERSHFFVLAMAATGLLGIGLTREPGMYGRLIVALPALFAAAGLALHWLSVWTRGRLTQAARYAVVAAVVAFAASYNLSSYYGDPLGPDSDLWARAAEPQGPVNYPFVASLSINPGQAPSNRGR